MIKTIFEEGLVDYNLHRRSDLLCNISGKNDWFDYLCKTPMVGYWCFDLFLFVIEITITNIGKGWKI
jgi:hypothetical protein